MPKYGFNFTWMCNKGKAAEPAQPDLDALDFMVEQGFDFVRLPLDYRWWTNEQAYQELNDEILELVDDYVMACQERELHCCLNLHRAPGYCINRNDLEVHNLWTDQEARDGFVAIWDALADRYSTIEEDYLSFDLLNEPPELGQWDMTQDSHDELMRRAVAAIHVHNEERPVVIDGLAAGTQAIPSLADLPVTHSTRGYAPMRLSHYKAEWWDGHQGLEEPVWPNCDWDGRAWDIQALRDYYQPWRELEAQGAAVHVGEFGCFNQTPQPVALAWLKDLLTVFKESGWGYALWNFQGTFGIIDHGRAGARIEDIGGFPVDRDMLELLKEHRLS